MSELSLAGEFPAADEAHWIALVEKALRGADFEKALVTETADGLRIKPLYTAADDTGRAGLPGAAPYIRGFRPTSRERPWDICQLHAHPDPAAVNEAILDDLNGGVTSIALQIAGPDQTGVIVDGFEDFERVLDGVEIDFAPVSLVPGERYPQAFEMLSALAGRKAAGASSAACALNADPLGTLARSGALTDVLDTHYGQLGNLVRQSHECQPTMTAILVDARHYHDGGASEAQELACLCATMVAYLRGLERDGLAPSDILAATGFSLAADTDQFLSAAKLRAARLLIGGIAEACGAAASLPRVKLHVETSRRMLAEADPWVNILRTAMACAGAALGGADSITVLPFTWALGLPDAFSRRIARNIQIILQEESSLAAVADPAGGSWYVEALTRELAGKAWTLFQEIEEHGGMVEALAGGFVQGKIAETAAVRASALSTGRIELTGVSAYPEFGDAPVVVEPHRLAAETENPAITVEPIPLRPPSAPFDRLRRSATVHFDTFGKRPAVFLANLGASSEYGASARYARNFFAAGGLDVVDAGGFDDAAAAASAFAASKAKLVCIGAADTAFAPLATDTATALRKAGAMHVYLAGRPGDARDALQKAGVGTFIHKGCDMLDVLGDAHDYIGIRTA